jgi:hypothetical protein
VCARVSIDWNQWAHEIGLQSVDFFEFLMPFWSVPTALLCQTYPQFMEIGQDAPPRWIGNAFQPTLALRGPLPRVYHHFFSSLEPGFNTGQGTWFQSNFERMLDPELI